MVWFLFLEKFVLLYFETWGKIPSGCILFFWGLKTDQGRDALSWGQMFQVFPCCLVKKNDTISFWNVHCRKWTYFIGYAVSSERGVGYYSFGALFAYHRNNHHLVREGLPIIHLGEALSKNLEVKSTFLKKDISKWTLMTAITSWDEDEGIAKQRFW